MAGELAAAAGRRLFRDGARRRCRADRPRRVQLGHAAGALVLAWLPGGCERGRRAHALAPVSPPSPPPLTRPPPAPSAVAPVDPAAAGALRAAAQAAGGGGSRPRRGRRGVGRVRRVWPRSLLLPRGHGHAGEPAHRLVAEALPRQFRDTSFSSARTRTGWATRTSTSPRGGSSRASPTITGSSRCRSRACCDRRAAAAAAAEGAACPS